MFDTKPLSYVSKLNSFPPVLREVSSSVPLASQPKILSALCLKISKDVDWCSESATGAAALSHVALLMRVAMSTIHREPGVSTWDWRHSVTRAEAASGYTHLM